MVLLPQMEQTRSRLSAETACFINWSVSPAQRSVPNRTPMAESKLRAHLSSNHFHLAIASRAPVEPALKVNQRWENKQPATCLNEACANRRLNLQLNLGHPRRPS